MRKPDYFYIQSGVIPYRWNEGKVEVLLITSRKKKRWIIPKGIIEHGLTIQESAAKEALEEAGVEGRVIKEAIGEYNVNKWDGTCAIQVLLLKVNKLHDHWEEESFRKRKWIPLEEASELITNKKLKALFKSISITDPRFEKETNGK